MKYSLDWIGTDFKGSPVVAKDDSACPERVEGPAPEPRPLAAPHPQDEEQRLPMPIDNQLAPTDIHHFKIINFPFSEITKSQIT
jgi:hypothetical protein